MAIVILKILDGFLQDEFWYTGIQSLRFCKWLWILKL